jgi:general stress protein YciG
LKKSGTFCSFRRFFESNLQKTRSEWVEEIKKKSTRGFASMDPERQRAIASKGGQSVPKDKRSFALNKTLAAEAGRKGGQSVKPEQRSFAKDQKLASTAGRKGGQTSHTAD